MTAHSYSLRSRVSSSSLSNRSAPQSPLQRTVKSPRKGLSSTSLLQLKHVIGTTTTTPSGLSCCEVIKSYAYAAGSVAVLATIDDQADVTYRYFKARPTVVPLHQTISYYDSPSTSTTPTHRRNTFVPVRNCDDIGGSGINRAWSEDSSGQTWSARERIKTVTCVAISADGKILAVGETGYNPRVLLFSTATKTATDVPLSIITDHNIGVCSVAFSPDSKYLATLGDVNDGFLYIWQVNTTNGTLRLHSSNKCTTSVHDMSWIGDHVVTVGTRHIKIWQASNVAKSASPRRARLRSEGEVFSPTPAPLQGRNCLLGALVDATFTSIVAMSELQAIVCADDGHICLLDLGSGRPELTMLERTDTPVTVVAYRRDLSKIFWAGHDNTIQQREWGRANRFEPVEQVQDISNQSKTLRRTSRQALLRKSLGLSHLRQTNTVALACLNNCAIRVDADGTVQVLNIDLCDSDPDVSRVASHNASVQGAQELLPHANLGSFYTWAKSGELRFWTNSGRLLDTRIVDLDDSLYSDDAAGNELKVVRYWQTRNLITTGDRFGILKVFKLPAWTCIQTLRAHSAEVSGIDISKENDLLATCSRDRTIQVFSIQEGMLELLQTCDDHISAVTQVFFNLDGNRLVSCSADRTVVIRDRVQRESQQGPVLAFVPTRTVTLKAAPLSMCVVPIESHVLAIATMDRYLVKVDMLTGVLMSSFKLSDPESDDTVFLNGIAGTSLDSPDGRCLIVGYSSIDKSIRVYDLEKGVLLGRDAGHTEGISSIIVLDQQATKGGVTQKLIVSTGHDSTIMIWSLLAVGQPHLAPKQDSSQLQASRDSDSGEVLPKANPASLPPLRKILSKLDIITVSRQSSPTREISPSGLRRRPSRLALTSSIEETDEGAIDQDHRGHPAETKVNAARRSPSPPLRPRGSPKKQRSHSELRKNDSQRPNISQSPSPNSLPPSLPATPKLGSKVNPNSKLRRPPSVPSDLRARAAPTNRRQSVSGMTNHVSMSMATEQTCRMLQAYNKKLQDNIDELDLDELQAHLEAVLQTVKSSKARRHEYQYSCTKATKHDDKDEVNEITIKLNNAQIA